jgi:hypothetical protein
MGSSLFSLLSSLFSLLSEGILSSSYLPYIMVGTKQLSLKKMYKIRENGGVHGVVWKVVEGEGVVISYYSHTPPILCNKRLVTAVR